MTHLLWPTRSEQYFLLAEDMDLSDELDEFNEAPHVVNNYIALNNHHHHHHHQLNHHHSVNSEPPDLTKVITWISSCLMNFLCHIFMINNLSKKVEFKKGLFCYIHGYVTVQSEYIYSIVKSTLVRNSHHLRDWHPSTSEINSYFM